MNSNKKAHLIAFYLPQFHPIPENDKWWGKGFTEWTNVMKAKPLFNEHQQPVMPGELGFYDLRLPEVRQAQAELAKEHGIEGFCYWHYWLGNGKRLLERPFNEVLTSGKPDFPFCLAWANHDWKARFFGAKGQTLVEQKYPGTEDHKSHFNFLLKAFNDERYIKIDGKPLFYIYAPFLIPDTKQFIELWQDMAIKAGLKGIHFVGQTGHYQELLNLGFDSFSNDDYFFSLIKKQREINKSLNVLSSDKLINYINQYIVSLIKDKLLSFYKGRIKKYVIQKLIAEILPKIRLLIENDIKFKLNNRSYLSKNPVIIDYKNFVEKCLPNKLVSYSEYPVFITNWDTTPRLGNNGDILKGRTPDLFKQYLKTFLNLVKDKESDKRIIFVKSWNEWAEGNYLEPDRITERTYLNIIKENVFN